MRDGAAENVDFLRSKASDELSHELAGLGFGLLRDGTGIDDDQVQRFRLGTLPEGIAVLEEYVANLFAFVLVDFAAECMDLESLFHKNFSGKGRFIFLNRNNRALRNDCQRCLGKVTKNLNR